MEKFTFSRKGNKYKAKNGIIKNAVIMQVGYAIGHYHKNKPVYADAETLLLAMRLMQEQLNLRVTIDHSESARDQWGLVLGETAHIKDEKLIADIKLLKAAYERSTNFIGEYIDSVSNECMELLQLSVEMGSVYEEVGENMILRPKQLLAVSLVQDGAMTESLMAYAREKEKNSLETANNDINKSILSEGTKMAKEKEDEIKEEDKVKAEEEKVEDEEVKAEEGKEEKEEDEVKVEDEDEVKAEEEEAEEKEEEIEITIETVSEKLDALAELIGKMIETKKDDMESIKASIKKEVKKFASIRAVADVGDLEEDSEDKLDMSRVDDPEYFRAHKQEIYKYMDSKRNL